MKRFIVLFLATLAFLSSHAKARENWVGLYTLDQDIIVTRTPTVIQVQRKTFYKSSAKELCLPKGTQMSGRIINQPLLFSMDMDQIQFRKEVLKLGNIKYSLVHPPEKPAPVIKKLAPLPKKNPVRAGKKAALAKKKQSKRTAPTVKKTAPVVKKQPAPTVKKTAPVAKRQPARVTRKRTHVTKKRHARVTQKRPVRVVKKRHVRVTKRKSRK